MPKEAKPKRKAAEKSEAKSRGKRAPKDKNAPKRPLSAYMFFSRDWRERIKIDNPDAGFGDVGKLLGAKWKEMDDSEKEPYNEQAKKDRDRAEREKAAYEETKANGTSAGEDDEDED